MSAYYAVRKGRIPGIYHTWDECKTQVYRYPGAQYKKFPDITAAQVYMTEKNLHPAPYISEKKDADLKASFPSSDIICYTDGSCSQKRGGYGYLYIQNQEQFEGHGPLPWHPCTNQQAELYAIYKLLDDTKIDNLLIHTDSAYSIGCLTIWYHNWIKNGWITSQGHPVENKLLIENILQLMTNRKVQFKHVKGHSGNIFNERCDQLANQGRIMNNLQLS